ncbi:major facilitator superfamily domain-containing protein [Hyaloraphidium curvatum]|nr:major facilitator superfamily domain-containing protein [Hyaloraphidium curvatum]
MSGLNGSEAEAHAVPVSVETQAKPKKSWRAILWDSDYDTKTPEERNLVFKIDVAILIYACFGYFVKTLDQSNINNAFLSGMREDLGMLQNELNYAVLAFNVPYCVLAIPSNIFITKIRPSLYLPLLELGWTAVTIGKAFVTNVNQLYACQAILGALEAGYFPGVVYLIGSWYTRAEFSKRLSLFAVTAYIGAMFSGYLQAAVYTNLNGAHNLAGWKWLFVVDGGISFVSGMIGFFLIPDYPSTTKWKFFTDEEKKFAEERLIKDGRQDKIKYDWKTFQRIFSRWHVYLFTILYAIYNSAAAGWGYLGFLLKFSGGWTVQQINTIPTAVSATTLITTLLWGWLSDYYDNRFWVILGPMFVSFIGMLILAIWYVPFPVQVLAYFLGAVSSPIGTTMAYLTAVVDKDPVERTVTIGTMNTASYTIFIVGQLVLWPTSSAPRFPVGYIYTATTLFIGLFVTVAIEYLWRRDKRNGILYLPEGTVRATSLIASDTDSKASEDLDDDDIKKEPVNHEKLREEHEAVVHSVAPVLDGGNNLIGV